MCLFFIKQSPKMYTLEERIQDSLESGILYVRAMNLSFLPELPPNLTEIDCSCNKLSTLPRLPPLLVKLICDNNELETLPSLPESLELLSCEENKLTLLPLLPNSVLTLNCRYNELKNITNLPNQLTDLNCERNALTNICHLPDSITELNVSFNTLTTIPNFPVSIRTLDISNNFLSDVPTWPTGFRNSQLCTFSIDTNPFNEQFLQLIQKKGFIRSVTIYHELLRKMRVRSMLKNYKHLKYITSSMDVSEDCLTYITSFLTGEMVDWTKQNITIRRRLQYRKK